MREGHRDRLHVRVPDHCRRLCDSAFRRRRRRHDGPFHRASVLARLQLADGQRHDLHGHGRLACPGHAVARGPAPGSSAVSRPFAQLGDLGWRAFALLAAAFMAVPLVLVVLFSFNQSALTSLPLTGFTFGWYHKLFALGSFWPALWNSLIVAAFVAILSVAIGTMAALLLARMAPRRAEVLIGIISIPMMLPALIIGVAMMSYFVRLIDLPLGLP